MTPRKTDTDGPAPQCDVDFYADEAVLDPVTAYHAMLAHGSVVWLPKTGLHAICGYDALTTALRNHSVFVSGKGVSINPEVNAMLIGSTLHSDPPQHDATRAITFAPLTPKALGHVHARVEAEANTIADSFAFLFHADFPWAFTFPRLGRLG